MGLNIHVMLVSLKLNSYPHYTVFVADRALCLLFSKCVFMFSLYFRQLSKVYHILFTIFLELVNLSD